MKHTKEQIIGVTNDLLNTPYTPEDCTDIIENKGYYDIYVKNRLVASTTIETVEKMTR